MNQHDTAGACYKIMLVEGNAQVLSYQLVKQRYCNAGPESRGRYKNNNKFCRAKVAERELTQISETFMLCNLLLLHCNNNQQIFSHIES